MTKKPRVNYFANCNLLQKKKKDNEMIYRTNLKLSLNQAFAETFIKVFPVFLSLLRVLSTSVSSSSRSLFCES